MTPSALYDRDRHFPFHCSSAFQYGDELELIGRLCAEAKLGRIHFTINVRRHIDKGDAQGQA